MANLCGTVAQHGGIERSDLPIDPTNIEANLLLRVILRSNSNRQIYPLHFHGRWALLLATLEPKDVLTIQGALLDAEGVWHVKRESEAITQIMRDDNAVTLDSAAVAAGNVPEWLKLPPTRLVQRQYQYLRYLITLRDGVESNLFAVVLENAKPGPSNYGFNVGMNIVVVDRSFENMPVRCWSTQDEIPFFSIQLAMPQMSVEALPFLCIGDVIRCHRFRVAGRPKRFLNIRQSKYSSVVVFPVEGSSPQTAATLPYTPVTAGEHTVLDSDRAHARILHKWIRGRVSQETISDYLVDICDLRKSAAHRDIVVKVLRVLPDSQILVVSDGSTESPTQVLAAEPPTASQWLFAHVKPDMWIKMRNVHPRDDENAPMDSFADDCSLACNCSQVTLMGNWSFDVRTRAQRLARTPSSQQSEHAARSSSSAQPEDVANDRQHAARAREGDTPDTVGDTDIDEHHGSAQEDAEQPRGSGASGSTASPRSAPAVTAQHSPSGVTPLTAVVPRTSEVSETALAVGSRVVLFGLERHPDMNGLSGTLVKLVANGTRWKVDIDGKPACRVRVANVKEATGDGRMAEPAHAVPKPLRVRLTTTYGSQSFVRIPEMPTAFASGERAVVIGGFGVASAAENDLLFSHCKICNARSLWEHGDVHEAKRKRFTLPCGHWLFDLVFELKLELWDMTDRTQKVSVHVRDELNAFFGISPQAAARDAAELQRVHALLRALAEEHESNTMMVNLASYPDSIVACDTRIEQVTS